MQLCFFSKVKLSFSISSNLNYSYVWAYVISLVITGTTTLLLSLLCSKLIWRLFCLLFLTRIFAKTAYNCIPFFFSQMYILLLKCNECLKLNTDIYWELVFHEQSEGIISYVYQWEIWKSVSDTVLQKHSIIIIVVIL